MVISCLFTSTNVCLLPPLPSISLDEEVAANEEGIGIDEDTNVDDADAEANADTTANDAAPKDNDYATMPTTLKPIPTKKPTKKDVAAAAAKPPPPVAAAAAAAAVATSFSVDAMDPLTDNY